MSDPGQRRPSEAELETVIGHTFADLGLLRRALTHRSYAFEASQTDGDRPVVVHNNERLEFLGDAVLDLVIADQLFSTMPESAEGRLAKLRSAAVNTHALADVARDAGLGEAIRLGVGEESSGGRDKDSILADTFEAVLGAVYLDGGLKSAYAVILSLFEQVLDDIVLRRESLDYKTSLQEFTAARWGKPPTYEVTGTGPDHAKVFTAEVFVQGTRRGKGKGRSKKEAEQAAAKVAYTQMNQEPL